MRVKLAARLVTRFPNGKYGAAKVQTRVVLTKRRCALKYVALSIVITLSVALTTCRTAAPKQPVLFAVHGRVVDSKTKRPVANAQVYLEHSRVGALTDRAGEFTFQAMGPPGEYNLIAQYIGYRSVHRRLKVRGGRLIRLSAVELLPAPVQLDDLVVAYCRRYREPPTDTVGSTVSVQADSSGRYWEVCRPPKR